MYRFSNLKMTAVAPWVAIPFLAIVSACVVVDDDGNIVCIFDVVRKILPMRAIAHKTS